MRTRSSVIALFLLGMLTAGNRCPASQDANPSAQGTVDLTLSIDTPFFLHGMPVILRGELHNGTAKPVKTVPADRWRKNLAWDHIAVTLKRLGPPREELAAPVAADFTVEIAPGGTHTFVLTLDRYGAEEKRQAKAGIKLIYLQDGNQASVTAVTEFAVKRFEDLDVAEVKERVSRTGPDHKVFPNLSHRVRVAKVRFEGHNYLISQGFNIAEQGSHVIASNLLAEVSNEGDFVLGSLPDLRVMVAYEKEDHVVVRILHAGTGDPVDEDR